MSRTTGPPQLGFQLADPRLGLGPGPGFGFRTLRLVFRTLRLGPRPPLGRTGLLVRGPRPCLGFGKKFLAGVKAPAWWEGGTRLGPMQREVGAAYRSK